jgi:hypothetical protein
MGTGVGVAGALGGGVGGTSFAAKAFPAPATSADSGLRKVKAAAPAKSPTGTAETVTVSADSDRETIETTNAPLIESVSADADAEVPAAKVAKLKHALPNRLAVLSMATQAHRILAIDTGNTVFLSEDAGKHWKQVPAPWPGRAVKASLISIPAKDWTGYSPINGSGGLQAGVSATPGNGSLALSGQVMDRSGVIIPGVTVVVSDAAAHSIRSVRTDREGRYLFVGLLPGSYRIVAQAQGFETQVLDAVPVVAGRQNAANFTLTVGAVSQTVTVSSSTIELSAKTKAPSPALSQPAPLFAITTDNGDRWTSPDGITWKRE